MKRSVHVYAPLLAASALALAATGCRPKPEMQRCVDEQNHVVPESFCQASGVAQQPVTGGGYGGGGGGGYVGGYGYYPRPIYRYYYGGYGGWDPGSTVGGGSYTSLGGHNYTTSSSAPHSFSEGGHVSSGTTRGGFGSSHGGEGGGHGGGGGE